MRVWDGDFEKLPKYSRCRLAKKSLETKTGVQDRGLGFRSGAGLLTVQQFSMFTPGSEPPFAAFVFVGNTLLLEEG